MAVKSFLGADIDEWRPQSLACRWGGGSDSSSSSDGGGIGSDAVAGGTSGESFSDPGSEGWGQGFGINDGGSSNFNGDSFTSSQGFDGGGFTNAFDGGGFQNSSQGFDEAGFTNAFNDGGFSNPFDGGGAAVSFTDGSQSFGNFFSGTTADSFYPADSGGWNNFVNASDSYFGGNAFNGAPDFNATFDAVGLPSGMDLASDFGTPGWTSGGLDAPTGQYGLNDMGLAPQYQEAYGHCQRAWTLRGTCPPWAGG